MRKFFLITDKKFIQYNAPATTLPYRATKNSAGYDMFSPIDTTIAPNSSELIWTNVKATYGENEVLMLFVTSKMGKSHVMLANGTGVIDSDYFENPNNDGNLGFRLLNLGKEPYVIKTGDKIGQGVFMPFLTVDDEDVSKQKNRVGGFGSTGGN
ncbi:MAG: dUTP diphosphatase [Clostridia bacterium]